MKYVMDVCCVLVAVKDVMDVCCVLVAVKDGLGSKYQLTN